MTQRTAHDADLTLSAATEQVIREGGIIHEDALFDAAEMALDGASQSSIAERIKQARAKPYVPRGGWRER